VIGATGLTIIDKTWPRQVTALNVTCRTTDANFGDTVSMYALFSDQGYGEGVIGALQQDAPTGSTGIAVSSLLANSLYPGEYLYLASNSLGEIMSIDPSTNTIYCQIPTQTLYPAGTPISWRRYFIGPDFVLGPADTYIFGQGKIGGASIRPGIIVRVEYPGTGVAKTLYYIIQYLY
jgi:hypothetical protein